MAEIGEDVEMNGTNPPKRFVYQQEIQDEDPPKYMNEMAKEVYYRMDSNISVPESVVDSSRPSISTIPEENDENTGGLKFGWIKGVLVRCLLNIWGVMLFLRLSWVVGQSGIWLSALIILMAAVVTVITTLSMSAICTNGEIKGGGAYFMISRSLGPEFGGAIGLIFSLANAVAVAMYVVGFAETIRDILKEHDLLMVDETNDVRIIGLITVSALLALAIIGMEWEARAQLILLAILLIAIADFIIGTFIPPSKEAQSQGFVGYRRDVFVENSKPAFREGNGFFDVFSIFFPAATGILAGANISGDLKDAQTAIPKGTLLAILISSVVYILMAWMVGACVLRDAPGFVMVEAMANMTVDNSSLITVSGWNTADNLTMAKFSNVTGDMLATCTPGVDCRYGLLNDMQVMQLVSGFGPLIIAGIISATLSSALASLVSAPKVFQAVCKDKIFPGIQIFGKGFGPNDEPRWGYLLAFLIGAAFICIGDLNTIAPVISNFFLMSYTLINYSVFDASLAKSPGWRPSFRYYSMWVSLVGAVLCLAIMFIINWWAALVTFAIVAAIYIYVRASKPDINWGSSTQAHVYRNALQATMKLASSAEHVKNFRPQILALTGPPRMRPSLVYFSSNITKNVSLMVCGHIVKDCKDSDEFKNIKTTSDEGFEWLRKQKVKSLYNVVAGSSFRYGVQSLLQCVGAGKLKPNTLLLGFRANWRESDPDEVDEYVNVIRDALDMKYSVGILRMKEGLDLSKIAQKKKSKASGILWGLSAVAQRSFEVNHFNRKQEKGTIDVWWLSDDGGLVLLLPYIMTHKHNWSSCKLRLFTLMKKDSGYETDKEEMEKLLKKFRIEHLSLEVIRDMNKRVTVETKNQYLALLKGQMRKNGETEKSHPWKISQADLDNNEDEINHNLRLRELLKEHSSQAALIVMTMPVPVVGQHASNALYMSWLDSLTHGMPPILLMKGNGDSVLTFES